MKTDGRIVLNLNNRANWKHVWFTIAGLEVYAKRCGNNWHCIRQNRHMLFTKDARCSLDEIASNTQYEVPSVADNRARGVSLYGPSLIQ